MNTLDWSKIPDLAAVALLTCAFASVARREQTPFSGLWLIGWIAIAAHFAAFIFLPAPGIWGLIAADLGLSALTTAGLLFMYASVPYRNETSSKWMLYSLLGANALYICISDAAPNAGWPLDVSAFLLGALPVALTMAALQRVHHLLRWILVILYGALSIFLWNVQHRASNGADLAMNAVLFTVYIGCAITFWYTYRRATAGAFVTIAGFFAWAFVFVIAPLMETFLPRVQVESEVWNLPKYIVAVGMILILLEDQIAHNKYLALHDELTGLPNRRLFHDRLGAAIERARRTGSKVALMVVDLDQFKQVNDTLGHHAGDLLLQQVSSVFTGRVRITDTVARTGGDEFSIILEDTGSVASANQVAQFLIQLLNEPLKVSEKNVWVGASIGVAVFPDDATEMEDLCIAADLRMYSQKKSAHSAAMRAASRAAAPRALEDPILMRMRNLPAR
ncbi:MAG TPA: GGDEF domain-containing protein [Terracidiphilus sp.]|nr:GGDEF domain-containing protein [Terracidiphilus sp.]